MKKLTLEKSIKIKGLRKIPLKNYQLTQATVAKAKMLIRKPVAEVFEAFIDPAITTKFWFTKSSGRLEPDKQIQWDWETYNFSVQVSVKAI